MKQLKQLIIKEIEERYNKDIKLIETEEGLNKLSSWYHKKYKGNIKAKFKTFLGKKKETELKTELNILKEVMNQPSFNGELIITLEWKKNRTWGSTVKSSTNYGFEGEVVSGCGYCKQSTATAQALNSHLKIIKLLYLKKEEYLKQHPKNKLDNNELHRKILGYGAGYSILPSFEGGVGVNSHVNILESIGLEMRHISDAKWSDVYIITRKRKK